MATLKKFWPQVFVMMMIFTKMLQQNISSLNENRVLNKGKPTISWAFRQWNLTVQQYDY